MVSSGWALQWPWLSLRYSLLGLCRPRGRSRIRLLVLAGIGVGVCSSVIPYVCDQLAMARLVACELRAHAHTAAGQRHHYRRNRIWGRFPRPARWPELHWLWAAMALLSAGGGALTRVAAMSDEFGSGCRYRLRAPQPCGLRALPHAMSFSAERLYCSPDPGSGGVRMIAGMWRGWGGRHGGGCALRALRVGD